MSQSVSEEEERDIIGAEILRTIHSIQLAQEEIAKEIDELEVMLQKLIA